MQLRFVVYIFIFHFSTYLPFPLVIRNKYNCFLCSDANGAKISFNRLKIFPNGTRNNVNKLFGESIERLELSTLRCCLVNTMYSSFIECESRKIKWWNNNVFIVINDKRHRVVSMDLIRTIQLKLCIMWNFVFFFLFSFVI